MSVNTSAYPFPFAYGRYISVGITEGLSLVKFYGLQSKVRAADGFNEMLN